ncbi:MAG TPA: 23S rRNA (pseudouridine(1915)-N(3))-methyltransferase RlmH [Gemmatimonadaceae bacterium]|nr:23S rRNA (pseudouridine(1915)-N(3))-methyltransferase RlmH [Gemmatimonadaceae bacterium]
MRVLVAAVGKPRDAALAAAIREYEQRAARYWPLDVREVREGSGRRGAELVREEEARHLLAAVPAAARVVLCDERGDALTSRQFAALLQTERERAAEELVFVIGGAFGVGEEVRARAWRQLALAPWTLPHEMARLVLAEQLYRAGTIVRGEHYHKE